MRMTPVWQFVALAIAAAPSLSIAQGLARVTVEYENAPLTQVVQNFATFGGRQIAIGPGVDDQRVTTSVHDLAWDVALDEILAIRSLVARPHTDGALHIERERRLTVEYESTPLKEVLRSLERFAGRTIVLSQAAGDPWVTLSIHDMDWQRALDRVADAAGLVVRADSKGIFHVERRP